MTHPADAGKSEDTTEEAAGHDEPHPSTIDEDE